MAEDSPFISVVMAALNAGRSLAFSLGSLQAQDFRDFEVVLVDGGSNDDTLTVAATFGSMIATLISEPDKGIGDAWNKGVARARGRWLVFLNAGDALHPNHFARAYALIQHDDIANTIYFCDVYRFDTLGHQTRLIQGQRPTRKQIRRGGIGFPHPGSITPRSAFDVVGTFDTGYRIAVDADFLLRCFKCGFEFRQLGGCAYMAEGGISDRKFGRALQEYYKAAHTQGFVGRWESRIYPIVLGGCRPAYNAMRRSLVLPLRNAKHMLVALVNIALNLVPFAGLRRLCFRSMGLTMGPRSSIGLGARIYAFGRLSMGARSVVNRDCLLDNRGGIWIGDDVSIARDVHIYTAGHDVHSPFFEMTTAPVRIAAHAVIFARCSIMPGVNIGCGSVVYPGSVVTRDVPDYAIAAGIPARVIGVRRSKPAYRLHYPFPPAM